MAGLLFPDGYVQSVYDVDYEALYEAGFRAVIFDIDGTFVYHGGPPSEKSDALINKVKEIGFKTLFLSNNDEKRVSDFLHNVDSPYICDAEKPKKAGYLKALQMLETDKSNTVVIGDQMFSDIYGANKCGLHSILVGFILKDGETKLGKKRRIELVLIKLFRLFHKNKKRGAFRCL